MPVSFRQSIPKRPVTTTTSAHDETQPVNAAMDHAHTSNGININAAIMQELVAGIEKRVLARFGIRNASFELQRNGPSVGSTGSDSHPDSPFAGNTGSDTRCGSHLSSSTVLETKYKTSSESSTGCVTSCDSRSQRSDCNSDSERITNDRLKNDTTTGAPAKFAGPFNVVVPALDLFHSFVCTIVHAVSYFFVQAVASIRASSLVLGIFWPIIGPILVFCILIVAALWAISVGLHGVCDRVAVRTTSGALSWFIQVDLCHVISEATVLPDTSSGLTIVREGEAVGDKLNSLVDSSRDTVLYAKVARHVRKATGKMAIDLSGQDFYAQSADIIENMWTAHDSLGKFLKEYAIFEGNMMNVISVSLADFRTLKMRFDNILQGAAEQSTWDRMVNSLFQNIALGNWYYQYSAETALMATLAKSTASIVPELDLLSQQSDNLATHLTQSVIAALNEVKARLSREEEVTYDQCNKLRQSLSDTSGSKGAPWLTPWMPSQPDSACARRKLPKRCCMPLPKYAEQVDQQILAITGHVEQITSVSHQLVELHESLNALHNITSALNGRFAFAPTDLKEAQNVAKRMSDNIASVDVTWKQILRDPGPSTGTVKMVGKA